MITHFKKTFNLFCTNLDDLSIFPHHIVQKEQIKKQSPQGALPNMFYGLVGGTLEPTDKILEIISLALKNLLILTTDILDTPRA